MAANAGGLTGSQVLRGPDAPLYKTGFKVCVAVTSFGLLVAIVQHFQFRWSNTKTQEQDVEGNRVEGKRKKFTC
jgi:hypothetical protein